MKQRFFKNLLFIAILFTSQNVMAQQYQCTNNLQYPNSPLSVSPVGYVTEIYSCIFTTDYSVITGIVPGDYEFVLSSPWSHVEDGYISLYQNGSLLGSGYSPLTVTTTSVGNIEAHWSYDEFCGYGEGDDCYTPTVQCLTCNLNGCATPINVSHTLVGSARADISWNAVGGAIRYDVHLRENGSGPSGWVRYASLPGQTSRSLHYLAPNTYYDYIVRATCDGTWEFAAATDIRRFNTANNPGAPVPRKTNLVTDLNISPNPAHDYINLAYAVASKSDVNLMITDITGRTVFQKNINNVEGYQNETIDVSTLGKGYFMLVLQSGEDRIVKKFVTVR